MLPELVFMLLRMRNRVVLALTLFMKCHFLSMIWESLNAKYYTFFFEVCIQMSLLKQSSC